VRAGADHGTDAVAVLREDRPASFRFAEKEQWPTIHRRYGQAERREEVWQDVDGLN
jgi:hypothetical protein